MIRLLKNEDYLVINKYYKYFGINNVAELCDDPFRQVFVYIVNDDIVGFIDYSIIYDRIELNYIYVVNEYRRCNIANELIYFLLDEAKKNCCKNITLEVNENNKIARYVYNKNGFKDIAFRHNYYNGENAILMMKELISNE